MSSEWAEALTIGELLARDGGSIKTGPFGTALKASEYSEEGVPLISVREIGHGSFHIDTKTPRVNAITLARLPEYILEEGDIVFARKGGVERCALIGPRQRGWFLGSDGIRLRPPVTCDARFIAYALQTVAVKEWLVQNSTGSTMASLNQATIGRLPIALPGRSYQIEIADVLESLDDRITLLRETNTTLEAIAQALFKSWFVDFDPVRAKAEGLKPQAMDAPTAALFPDSFEESELGLVPKGWKVMPFLDVCDLQGGAQPPASTFIDEPRDGYVRLLQIRDFSTDAHKTYIPDTKKLKKVTEDDVLIGRYGSASGDKAKDSLGRVCRGLSGSYNVALMKLSPVQVGKEFAFQLVSDAGFYGYLQGVSSKAVQSGFSKSELGQYKVVVPPRELAEQFEQFGEVIWKSVKENRKQAQTLSHLRDTLLPRLISGQLRLPEAETLLENAL